MPRIPFMTSVRIPKEMPEFHVVERRLRDFLERLRLEAGLEARPDPDAPWPHPRLTRDDRVRTSCRAKADVARVTAATGLEHLETDASKRLDILRDGANLVAIPSEHRGDEIAAALHEDMPWMAPATDLVWRAMRASVRQGSVGLRLPPMLLVGPPGIGKSRWARRLAAGIGLPACT